MIIKWYQVFCGLCDNPLSQYPNYKPTPIKLRNDRIKIIINNGKILTYCDDCYNKIKDKAK